MILERFSIHNLFSYCGTWDFDLRPSDDGRNILLIWGRNGYGKTSFLNSLKLLFTGVSEELRGTVHIGRNIKRDHYLLGMGDEWVGIFNRHARAAGEKRFGVSLVWREAAGTVTVERIWQLEKGNAGETLRVTPSFGDPLEDQDGDIEGEARAFIQERLPEAVMPFFIYDGERVQQLAEANRDGQLEKIEQLLDLADIDVIDEYLGRNLTAWRKDSNDASQHKINSLHHEIQAFEEKLAGLDADRKSVEDEIAEAEYAVKRLDTALQARRQFALQSEEAQLATKREGFAARLEERTLTFFESFTRDAPLVLHPLLMGEVAHELEKIAAHPNRRLKDELGRVFNALPERLFDDPPLPVPPLTQDQEEFLRRKLARVMDSYRPDAEDMTSGLFHLSPLRAEALLRVADEYSHDERKRARWASDLADIRRIKSDLAEIERKLNDVSNLAPQERQLFEERITERDTLNIRIEELHRHLGGLAEQERNFNRELGARRDTCRAEERKLVGANAARGKLGIGQRLQHALASYRSLLKARRRSDIEAAINSRFIELMTSHTLIRHIQVNDDFSLHYFDANGQPVGMGNLSAGMKQLVALALLWGLKDVSGKEAPVVVDTPLARIDRQHQENLITCYYPKAGPQVIVLPTDSELDREKHALLKSHVYREYRLINPEGDQTSVELGGYY
ncbi:DNA sulfur modification protein DndD [Sulfuritalea sp.]|uniref:DNA sulfur modification protein DndD n=1 Tax=Sulfuritalea sp. TaxID=2480090 RepID=UPI00286EA18E|nr:DNA sulfur modification protein DndD [Sulfuritalea sp.]